MAITDLFRQTVTLVETTRTVGAIGGPAEADGATLDVLGYGEPLAGTEDRDDANRQIGDWRFWLPPETDVSPYDRLRYAGRTFDITAPPRPRFDVRAGADDHIELDAREVTT